MQQPNNVQQIPGQAIAPAVQSAHKIQMIGPFRVPYGYEIWANGVWRVTDPITDDQEQPGLERIPSPGRKASLMRLSDRPLWIEGFSKSLDTKEELVCLGFRTTQGDEDTAVWVSRAELANRRQLETLARVGLPVRTGNAAELETYLARAIGENGPQLDWQISAARCGMYQRDDSTGFLIGKDWIGRKPAVVMDPRNDNDLHDGFRASGDLGAWVDKFVEIASKNATTSFLCHATFVAPIMRLIRQRSFVLHHWGMTSGGKTALLRFGMSAWGHPIDLTSSFNSTAIGAVEIFRYIDNLPIAYDELQASTNKDHSMLIYHMVQEKGRRRARSHGGLEMETNTWRTIIRTTGEEPIIGSGKIDLGGQKKRVLEVNAVALTSNDARDLHHWMENGHYGLAGRAFLSHLVDAINADPEFVVRLYEKYRLYSRAIGDAAPGIDERSDAFAAIVLAGRLFGAWILGADPDAYTDRLLTEAIAVANGTVADEDPEDIVTKALGVLRDHFTANPSRWINLDDFTDRGRLDSKGYDGLMGVVAPTNGPEGEIWLIPGRANDLLTRAGIPHRRVWTDLRKEGAMRPSGEKRPFGESAQGKRWRSCHIIKLPRILPV